MGKTARRFQLKNIKEMISNIKSRHVVTAVAAFLLFLLYIIIFGLSAQDAEQSGGLSQMISAKCIELMNAISGKHWTTMFQEELALYFEHPIRKLAHFTEYACMGTLVYIMWRPWRSREKGLFCLVVLWVLISAAADEFHQLFVPGRYGSIADVCLDTCGGAFAVLVCCMVEKIYKSIIGRITCNV